MSEAYASRLRLRHGAECRGNTGSECPALERLPLAARWRAAAGFAMERQKYCLGPRKSRSQIPPVAGYEPQAVRTRGQGLHLEASPAAGVRPLALDTIRTHAIETLKASLLAKELSPKRVNNVLACLGKMLRCANEIEILEVVPRIK